MRVLFYVQRVRAFKGAAGFDETAVCHRVGSLKACPEIAKTSAGGVLLNIVNV